MLLGNVTAAFATTVIGDCNVREFSSKRYKTSDRGGSDGESSICDRSIRGLKFTEAALETSIPWNSVRDSNINEPRCKVLLVRGPTPDSSVGEGLRCSELPRV